MQSLQRKAAVLAQFVRLRLASYQTYLGHVFPLRELPSLGYSSSFTSPSAALHHNTEKPQLSITREKEAGGRGVVYGMVGQE